MEESRPKISLLDDENGGDVEEEESSDEFADLTKLDDRERWNFLNTDTALALETESMNKDQNSGEEGVKELEKELKRTKENPEEEDQIKD